MLLKVAGETFSLNKSFSPQLSFSGIGYNIGKIKQFPIIIRYISILATTAIYKKYSRQ